MSIHSILTYKVLNQMKTCTNNVQSKQIHICSATVSCGNLPTLNLNHSESTTEDNILCALSPSPKSDSLQHTFPTKTHSDTPITYYREHPSFECLTKQKKKRSHIKASKSFNINHITSQRPPMPSYYFSSRHSHNASTSSSLSTLSTTSSWNEFIFSPKKKPIHSKHQSMKNSEIEPAKILKLQQSNSMNDEKRKNKLTQKERYNMKRQVHFHSGYAAKPQSTPSKMRLCDKNIIKNNTKKKRIKRAETVRVIRDKEVLQIDEEIPMKNFLGALKKGYARIMTENEQNEEYKKSARIARSVSVGNMQAWIDEIHEEEQQQKKQRPKTTKNSKIFQYEPPKILSIGDRDDGYSDDLSSSSCDDLVGPPRDIEVASPLMLKPAQHKNEHIRSKTMHKKIEKKQHKNARIRSQTAPKPKVIFLDTLSRRKRANHYYAANKRLQPSLQCPTSPSIPEEDDILDIIHLDDDVSDQSTTGFSSDSDSASSHKYEVLDNSVIKRTESDEYDLDLNETENDKMRKRANSNSSITSNSCSSSSSSSRYIYKLIDCFFF